jgi:phenylalanyl-tRNA synthetase beta chain
MKLSEHWLREWVKPTIDSDALVEQLTMAGLEVDGTEVAAEPFSGICVGYVESTQPHPNATKLTLCKIDIGTEALIDIVCGAKNVRAGLKVAVATVGALLPGGMKIKKAKLRGEPSLGMLCSVSELGLADTSEGIMELPEETPIGVCLRQLLNLDDTLIDIDLTPNRGDCLSVRGIAREVAALNDISWQDITIDKVESGLSGETIATVNEPLHCPNYLTRLIKNVNCNASVPLWMSERLRRSGLRSHSLAVDITNYVMMELGQPMHAFDAGKIDGSICVRMAIEGESLTLLDGQSVDLKNNTLVIADDSKVLAIAGVMGGQESAVSTETTEIIFESAHFKPELLAGVARSYGLATDSSYRFERGVSSDLQHNAMERATELLVRFAGGEVQGVQQITHEDLLPQNKEITLFVSNVNRLLGMTLTLVEVRNYLSRLGMQITEMSENQLLVNVPQYRFDISIEADLIEEIARIHGYNEIPLAPITASFQAHKTLETKLDIEHLRQLLVDLGYSESINYSFVCPDKQQQIYGRVEPITLLNPLSKELSQMRVGLFVGLLNAYHFNLSRQQINQRLFEVGLCFDKKSGELEQKNYVAGLIAGHEGEHDWSLEKRAYDFYDLKGDLEALFGASMANIRFEPSEHIALHPGKSAAITKNGITIGYLGELHPRLMKALSLTQVPLLFEIEVDALLSKTLPKYQALSKYPSISRDLSLIMEEHVSFFDVSASIQSIQHDVPLKKLDLFDVYQGKNIGEGKKSMAIGLTLQHSDRTLVDSEVNDYMSAILLKLEEKFNITLRE